jgi:molybdopterin converting factor subunit 1
VFLTGPLRLSHAPLAVPSVQGYNYAVPATVSIRVNVLYFGQIKELLGRAQECAELPDASSIEELFLRVASRNPELKKFRGSLVASRNQEFASWNTLLHAGDEVGFLPPVSGG